MKPKSFAEQLFDVVVLMIVITGGVGLVKLLLFL